MIIKILAVDDDSLMTEFYEGLFSGAGYEVKTAPDAHAGIGLFYDYKPDLIVLDAEMPGGGGGRMFRTVRTILGCDIPVIFITGLPGRYRGKRDRERKGDSFSHDNARYGFWAGVGHVQYGRGAS